MERKQPLADGEIYHVFNKSIAGFTIFNVDREYERFKQMLLFFSVDQKHSKFSHFQSSKFVDKSGFYKAFRETFVDYEVRVEIIAYCIMPTHFHLMLKQVKGDGISRFVGNLQNSYTRYFNETRRRKGPLWVGRFKNVLVETDEQLLHLTRYLHLNPVKANLCRNASTWDYSSFQEYIGKDSEANLCTYASYLDEAGEGYKDFVDEYSNEQKAALIINKLTLD
ncbi:MAG: putative transposase [Candidatus Omnitrophota bacterium]|jgi:putative transposase